MNQDTKMDKAIDCAIKWRKDHFEHVARLMDESITHHEPCAEDLFHPELWKGASWLWLNAVVPVSHLVNLDDSHKKKRGRPKGSKNKPKITTDYQNNNEADKIHEAWEKISKLTSEHCRGIFL